MGFVSGFLGWLAEAGTSWKGYAGLLFPALAQTKDRAAGHLVLSRRRRAVGGDRARELLAREGVANDPGPYAARKDDGSTRHRLIASSRVNGVAVTGKDGNPAGRIRELSIDKKSGRVAYALVGTGGFLGFAEKIYPVPWSLLSYDPNEEAYRVPFRRAAIEGAPSLTSADLEWFGAGDEAWRFKTASYYNSYAQIPF